MGQVFYPYLLEKVDRDFLLCYSIFLFWEYFIDLTNVIQYKGGPIIRCSILSFNLVHDINITIIIEKSKLDYITTASNII